jgi:hypothetical protein
MTNRPGAAPGKRSCGAKRLWVDGPRRGEAINRVSVAALPFRRRIGSRVGCRGRGHRLCITQHPVPLRWTSNDTEPREAA